MLYWLLFSFQLAHAEYRVFELVITNPTTGQERVVKSNFGPNQYRSYFPVSPFETITYRATWMCKGNTSMRKPFCPNPKDQQ